MTPIKRIQKPQNILQRKLKTKQKRNVYIYARIKRRFNALTRRVSLIRKHKTSEHVVIRPGFRARAFTFPPEAAHSLHPVSHESSVNINKHFGRCVCVCVRV